MRNKLKTKVKSRDTKRKEKIRKDRKDTRGKEV